MTLPMPDGSLDVPLVFVGPRPAATMVRDQRMTAPRRKCPGKTGAPASRSDHVAGGIVSGILETTDGGAQLPHGRGWTISKTIERGGLQIHTAV